jgi:glycine betaine/choline ABC-type transport system substrate-binding protein
MAAVCAAALGLLSLQACRRKAEPGICVGAKATQEQHILGEILAQFLEKHLAPVKVYRNFSLGATDAAHVALQLGEIDLYPEYGSAALTKILGLPPTSDAAACRDQVVNGYHNRMTLEWMAPLGFDAHAVMVTSKEVAAETKVHTLSDAANYRKGWSLGVTSDFQSRPDGYGLLMRGNPLVLNSPVRVIAGTELYAALLGRQVTLASGRLSDASLLRPEFAALADDRGVFPPDEAAVAVRQEALKLFPGLGSALLRIQGKISLDKMRQMNAAVERDRRSPEDVAREFLAGARL